MLQGAIGGAEQLKPVEYAILTQVEAASALWRLDRARSTSIFRDLFAALRQMEIDDSESREANPAEQAKRQKLRFLVLRKTAQVSPELLEELLQENSANTSAKEKKPGQWTDEARALMSVAWERMENDPALAARIAQRSLSLGLADWWNFLERLNQHDPAEAERLAIRVIDWLRDGPFISTHLLNFRIFALTSDRSPQLQHYFIQALVDRLRRDLRPDTPTHQLERDLSAAREMRHWAASSSPHWQAEFGALTFGFESMFKARSMDLPGPSPVRVIDASMLRTPQPASTQEIIDALSELDKMEDSEARDKQYQRLAIRAALSANVWLAEKIISKIGDDQFRRETTIKVYTPLIRTALKEQNFTRAQAYALKILDPLGRTLALDRIAHLMARAEEDNSENNSLVLHAYDLALAGLWGEAPTEETAKSFLVIAQSLLAVDLGRGLSAASLAVSALNKLTKRGVTLGESKLGSAALWVAWPHFGLKQDEILDLTEMMRSLFTELAKHDAASALSVASGLAQPGLRSLALVAISRGLLDQVEKASAEPH